jgi:dienelactone hydrolase
MSGEPGELVIVHSLLGLRPSILEFAAELRTHGYMFTPLISSAGKVFNDYQSGREAIKELGGAEVVRRAQTAFSNLPERLCYAGFSMGAELAALGAGSRPGARGALLLHGAATLDDLELPRWPSCVPVQIHFAEDDPWIDHDAVHSFQVSVTEAGSPVEVYTYPGGGHLFADRQLDDYDHDSTRLALDRAAAFLAQVS